MQKSLFMVAACVCFVGGRVSAQQAVSASGGDAVSAAGTVSYTVGQIDYTSNTGISGFAYQGVQQPHEIFTVGIRKAGARTINISIFPNPSASFITLRTNNVGIQPLSYQLYDMYGRLLLEQKISSPDTDIPIQDLAPSAYLLKVSSEIEIQLFKIIKN